MHRATFEERFGKIVSTIKKANLIEDFRVLHPQTPLNLL
jgi:hypothetical protein